METNPKYICDTCGQEFDHVDLHSVPMPSGVDDIEDAPFCGACCKYPDLCNSKNKLHINMYHNGKAILSTMSHIMIVKPCIISRLTLTKSNELNTTFKAKIKDVSETDLAKLKYLKEKKYPVRLAVEHESL